MMYDPLVVRQAIMAHAQARHAGRIDGAAAGSMIGALAKEAALYADPIAEPAEKLAARFQAGELCTVIIPGLAAVACADDGAHPAWSSDDGILIVYTEAEAREKTRKDLADMRRRYPGFPRNR